MSLMEVVMNYTKAEQELIHYATNTYEYDVVQVSKRMYHIIGLDHSNVTVVIGNSSVLLVDALDSDMRGERLKEMIKKWTPYEVKTIIYTHGHPDHRGGSKAFSDSVETIIQSKVRRESLKYMDKINDHLQHRATYQFGHLLSGDDFITQGLGIREGGYCNNGKTAILPCTEYFSEERKTYCIDGISFSLISAPGETNDTMYVYFPEEKALCCGDNFYGCFPNVYAIRGTQYRDLSMWIDSLRIIPTIDCDYLLRGHSGYIKGNEEIVSRVTDLADCLQSILFQTLDCINKGYSQLETARMVTLEEKYRDIVEMKEFYGLISWGVRSIYCGYVGWFDGNPSNLCPLTEKEWSIHLCSLLSKDVVLKSIEGCLAVGDYQKALQMVDLVELGFGSNDMDYYRKKALVGLARNTISSNARNYYLSAAKHD